jgi:hypothetical protein
VPSLQAQLSFGRHGRLTYRDFYLPCNCSGEGIQHDDVLMVVLYTGFDPACGDFRTVSSCASVQPCSRIPQHHGKHLNITCTTAIGQSIAQSVVVPPVSAIVTNARSQSSGAVLMCRKRQLNSGLGAPQGGSSLLYHSCPPDESINLNIYAASPSVCPLLPAVRNALNQPSTHNFMLGHGDSSCSLKTESRSSCCPPGGRAGAISAACLFTYKRETNRVPSAWVTNQQKVLAGRRNMKVCACGVKTITGRTWQSGLLQTFFFLGNAVCKLLVPSQ